MYFRRPLIVFLLAASLAMTGCETLSGLIPQTTETDAPPLPERTATDPIDSNTFVLDAVDQSVVGEPQLVLTTADDTFADLARTYGLGYDELLAANPGVDPWLPGEGTPVLLPTQFVLPDAPRRGVILNIATRRLFYFPAPAAGEAQQVLTYPIGIGRVGWETPLGETTVVAKAKDPTWWVPASVRREHAEMGDPLPSVVPPGPDNPLGTRVLKLNMPGYLIHGTNQPYGVGMRVSHGCVRLYPENIEFLYSLVDVGEVVTIVNEPYQFGQRDGIMYFEAHAPLEDDEIQPDVRLQALLDKLTSDEALDVNAHLANHMRELSAAPTGVPISIAEYDESEALARALLVHNIVEADPNEPTLTEVREMMDEVAAEMEASESLQ